MFKRIFKSFFALAFFLVAALALLFLYRFFHSQFSITTNAIEFLPPHFHEADVRADAAPDDPIYSQDTRAQFGLKPGPTFQHGILAYSDTVPAPEDMWVTGFKVEVLNAPSAALHHFGLLDLSNRSTVCPSALPKEIFAATADALTPIQFLKPYGLFIPKGTPLRAAVMFHNPYPPFGPGGEYRDVSARLVMNVQKEVFGRKFSRLQYYRLRVEDEPCAEPVGTFVVPPNTGHFVTKGASPSNPLFSPSKYKFYSDGNIVHLQSHLHPWEGGESVEAFLNGEQFLTFAPQKTSEESWSWQSEYKTGLFPVKDGDTLNITATYSNDSDRPIFGAMGMVWFYFAPNKP